MYNPYISWGDCCSKEQNENETHYMPTYLSLYSSLYSPPSAFKTTYLFMTRFLLLLPYYCSLPLERSKQVIQAFIWMNMNAVCTSRASIHPTVHSSFHFISVVGQLPMRNKIVHSVLVCVHCFLNKYWNILEKFWIWISWTGIYIFISLFLRAQIAIIWLTMLWEEAEV